MPKGKKHTPEQIVAILRRIDGGESAQAVSREVNISEATLHRWKQQYRRAHEMLRRQGLHCNLRTVQRMRRDQGLGIKGPARRPKVPLRPDAKLKAVAVNDVWCVDVVFDTTQGGNTVKFLTIIDEYSHYCLGIVASRRMPVPWFLIAQAGQCSTASRSPPRSPSASPSPVCDLSAQELDKETGSRLVLVT